MFEDFPQAINQRRCLRCDICCRFDSRESLWRPKVARGENFFLGHASEIDNDEYVKAVESENQVRCGFFNGEDNKCRDYGNRPLDCRIYPFLIIRDKGKIVVAMHLCCEYIFENQESDSFQRYLSSIEDFFKRREICLFIKANPAIVSEYLQHRAEIKILFPLEL